MTVCDSKCFSWWNFLEQGMWYERKEIVEGSLWWENKNKFSSSFDINKTKCSCNKLIESNLDKTRRVKRPDSVEIGKRFSTSGKSLFDPGFPGVKHHFPGYIRCDKDTLWSPVVTWSGFLIFTMQNHNNFYNIKYITIVIHYHIVWYVYICCQLFITNDEHLSRTFADVQSLSALGSFKLYLGISMQLWQISDKGTTALSGTPPSASESQVGLTICIPLAARSASE